MAETQTSGLEKVMVGISLAQVAAGCLVFYGYGMMVLPTFLDRRQALLETLKTKDPAMFAGLQERFLFRLLEVLAKPQHFLMDWSFLLMPVAVVSLAGLVKLLWPRLPSIVRVLGLQIFSALFLVAVVVYGWLVGFGGCVLIAHWRP